MAGKGLPKTPTSILKARGSWRSKLPERANEPHAIPEADLACPRELSGVGAETWNRLIVPLFAYGVVTVIDRDAAISLCYCWHDYVEARAVCEREGFELHGEKGVYANPAYRRMRESLEMYHRIAPHFGIMPGNRSRLTNAVTKRPAEDTQDKSRFFKAV